MAESFFSFDAFDADKARRRRGKRKAEDDGNEEDKEAAALELAEEKRRLERKAAKAKAREESPPPTELRDSEDFPEEEEQYKYFIHWGRYILHRWQKDLEEGKCPEPDFRDEARRPVDDKLKELFKLMRKGEISSALTSKLVEFARAAAKQEFSKCNQVYMDMTIGNAKWHSDQALGEVRHNKGIKIKKIKATEGVLLEDAIVKSYVIATKRLAVYHQKIHPPDDISKRMINF